MARVTLFFVLLKFLSPAHRGGLLQSVILFFKMGTVADISQGIKGIAVKIDNYCDAFLFPGFSLTCSLNHLVQCLSRAFFFALLVRLFPISVPLVFLGLYIAVQKPAKLPVRTNNIQRHFPHWQPCGRLYCFPGSSSSCSSYWTSSFRNRDLLLQCPSRPYFFCSSCGLGLLYFLCSSEQTLLSDGIWWSSQCKFPYSTSISRATVHAVHKNYGICLYNCAFLSVYTDLFFIMSSLWHISSIDSSIY